MGKFRLRPFTDVRFHSHPLPMFVTNHPTGCTNGHQSIQNFYPLHGMLQSLKQAITFYQVSTKFQLCHHLPA